MKYIALLISLALIIGCSSHNLEGSFIKVKENDRGSSMNVLGISLVEKVQFTEEFCRFEYAGIPMSGEYKIDGKYVFIEMGGELGTLSMEIIDDQTLEGEGWISGTFK